MLLLITLGIAGDLLSKACFYYLMCYNLAFSLAGGLFVISCAVIQLVRLAAGFSF